jgi:hypothetical protein
MSNNEKRLRKAIDDLHRYAENLQNPLNGPEFARLLDELDLARDAMAKVEEEADDRNIYP